ncbi:MAG: hypothetical protein GY737_16390 [Desulfobacteraceae bacterium]|nr:hypothetical protein [Desulfobacteraceae bacterium]
MNSVYRCFHGKFQIAVKCVKNVLTILKGRNNMLTDKKEKSTTGRRSLVIVIFCIAVTVLTGVNAFAQHYLNQSVRDSLTHKEKIVLLLEEQPDLSWYEVESRAKSQARASHFKNPEIKGRNGFRTGLSPSESVRLFVEEHKNLMPHDILKIREKCNRPQGVFRPEKNYVYGSFRANLSDAEKRQLINEEY